MLTTRTINRGCDRIRHEQPEIRVLTQPHPPILGKPHARQFCDLRAFSQAREFGRGDAVSRAGIRFVRVPLGIRYQAQRHD